MTVYEKLLEVKDDKYKEFQAKLVPNIDAETILGVKTPAMRKIVKYIEERKLDDWVLKKTIQKAVESFRVTDEHKEYLKSFR